jgi:hypothetical protein
MPIYKIQAGRIITVESSTWVGPEGTIWYDEILGDLRIGDGYTPGGRLISTSVAIGYTGSQGNTGTQGIIGFTGSTGTQGPIGFTGSTGTQGLIGYTGSTGTQGLIGYTGSTGTQGLIGFTGSTGTQGITGYTGSTGTQGDIGFTGSTGTQGLIGYTGSTGTQGEIGFTGSTGTQGLIGFTGSTGTQGEIGFTGSTGTQGITGYTGSTGTQGEIGFTGSTGTQGPRGYTGSFGLGLTTDQTSTVTLSTGFKFIPETDGIQDLGSLTNRFGKIFLAGQTIDLGGTILSVDPTSGGLIIKNSAGELETVSLGAISIGGSLTLASSGTSVSLLATGTNLIIDASVVKVNNIQATGTVTLNSIKVGSTSTTSGVTITVDQYDNILFTSANGTILNGYTGSTGTQGSIGFTGSTGTRGEVGFTGSIGSTGTVGFTGSTGTQGVVGFTGSIGSTGTVGFTGSTGTQGIIGFTGSTGTQGIIGFTGSTGTVGYTGSIGYTGSQGIVSAGLGLVYTTATGNIYLDSTIVTTTGTQTLTNKTIIVPSGGALYFNDDVALSLLHGASTPYKQTSAAPRMFTNASFGIVGGVLTLGTYWADSLGPDVGYNTVGTVATPADLPSNYTGMAYDAYTVLDTGNSWLWLAPSTTDMKPGDYYYNDVDQILYICYEYTDPDTGLTLYNNLDITPK